MSTLKKALALILSFALIVGLSATMFAAPTIDSSAGKNVYKLVNQARSSRNVNKVAWSDDLAAAAEIRAKELCQKYTANHTRPDGRSCFSVSTLVMAENTAYGYKTSADVMDAWMDSTGHRENLLRDTYTIMGAACAQADDGTYYWVQLFGNGKSNASWAGVEKYTLDPFNDANVKLDGTASSSGTTSSGSSSSTSSGNTSSATVDKNGSILEAGIKAKTKTAVDKSTSNTVNVSVTGATAVSPAALKAMAGVSSGKTIVLRANTPASSGKGTQGRLYLNATKLQNTKNDIKLGVYVDSSSISSVKKAMENKYNANMAYIHMEHSGSLGASSKVMAKVNLDNLDTSNLKLYVYNNGSLTPIENSKYKIDSNGYLVFYTKTAGDIVISGTALK